jgi:site-specific DNA-cytosine methylase
MDGETDTLLVANTVTASAGHHGHSSPRGDGSDNLVLAFTERTRAEGARLEYQEELAYALTNPGEGGRSDDRCIAFYPTNRNPDEGVYEEIATTLKHEPGAVAVSLRNREGKATAEMGDEVSHALRSSKGGGDKPHVLAFDWQASAGNDTSWRGKGRQFIVRKGEQAGTLTSTRVDAVMTTAPMPLYYTHDYNQDRVYSPDGVAPAVCAADSGGARNVLTSNDGDPHSNFSPVAVVRRLLPIECSRLQGFPDDWIPSTIADSHHYRMLGNAVCVPVVEWLLRRLAAALEAS